MALAFLLIVVLVTIIWLSRPEQARKSASVSNRRKLQIVSAVFFLCLFAEGLLGSQLREQTDELAIAAETSEGIDREQWGEELGSTLVYKVHRSFSWSLLLTSGLLMFWTKRNENRAVEPKLIFAMVVAMMVMGVVLAHVSIYAVVQVLHVGMTSILLAVTWHWIMRLWSSGDDVTGSASAAVQSSP